MKTETKIKLSDLHLNDGSHGLPKNPRFIRDERFKKLCDSIRDFPEAMPARGIVVDENGVILGGNMRYRACIANGMTEIPASWVHRLAGLTVEQKRRFIIMDNRLYGDDDFDLLANEWDLQELINAGFDEDDLLGSKLADFTAEPRYTPVRHVKLGAFCARRWVSGKSSDYETFKKWKAQPSAFQEYTNAAAHDVAVMVKEAVLNWRGFIITCPPAGVSSGEGKEYPAGFLAKSVSVILGVDFVTLFKPTGVVKGHHPMASVELLTEPFKLAIEPPMPVIIIDDAVTSGTTGRLSVEALGEKCCAFYALLSMLRKK